MIVVCGAKTSQSYVTEIAMLFTLCKTVFLLSNLKHSQCWHTLPRAVPDGFSRVCELKVKLTATYCLGFKIKLNTKTKILIRLLA